MEQAYSRQTDNTANLLEKRRHATAELYQDPYDLLRYIERAALHADLGYPDLAAGDGYRALLLCDECENEEFEYHEQALDTLRRRCAGVTIPTVLRELKNGDLVGGVQSLSTEEDLHKDEDKKLQRIVHLASIRCYQLLSISLILCGCLQSAFEFCTRGLAIKPDDEELLQAKEYVERLAGRRLKIDEWDVNDLPDQGLVRREVYPWNDHEPNRFSQETLDFLNSELQEIAPKCEVKVTELPTLLESASSTDCYGIIPTNKQLGLFAKEDIEPGEVVLDEISVLAANNRLKESLCDACSVELPPLSQKSEVVGCPDCDDITFCSQDCLDRALETYHPAVCNKDIDTFAKDPDPKEKPFALYMLLLSRALAMSVTQDVHPLELKEVKYIWGDFLSPSMNEVPLSSQAPPPPIWTLPFSFKYNVSGPLHILEKMDIDIYTELENFEQWVFNTLYAKFRGTASARVSKEIGSGRAGPEVAAVHPLWCLANHDCDPNVQWEWGGRMKLWAREKRVDGGPGGLKKGDEVLNHYCDVELPVKERREWAKGSLGGWCMCDRCRREAPEEDIVDVNIPN